MNKTGFLIFLFLLLRLSLVAQDLTCSDFKLGKFYIPETKEMNEFTVVKNDSISGFKIESDSIIKKYIVIREENTQTEWINGVGIGKPEYEILEWLDECSYRLTFDASKLELDEEKRWINDNHGIVVTKSKIEGNCMFYKATLTTIDGQNISQNGVICRE